MVSDAVQGGTAPRIEELSIELDQDALPTRYIEYATSNTRHGDPPRSGSCRYRHVAGAIEDDVVFIEVGPVGPMRQFGDRAKRVLARPDPSRAGFVPLERQPMDVGDLPRLRLLAEAATRVEGDAPAPASTR